MLRYDENGANDDQILVRVSAPDFMEVECTFKTIQVHQLDFQKNGGTDIYSVI